jgi:hypothetical protein
VNTSSTAGALLKVDALKFVTTQAKTVQIGGRGPAVGGGWTGGWEAVPGKEPAGG